MQTIILINILHIFLISGLLLYISYNGYFGKPIQPIWFVLLFIIGVYGFIYHFYDTVSDDNPDISRHDIANYLHLTLFAPITIYVSYQGYFGLQNQVSKIWYVLLFLFAIWSIVYHSYRVFSYLSYDSNSMQYDDDHLH